MAILRKEKNKEKLSDYALELRKRLRGHQGDINVEITKISMGDVLFKDPITKETFEWTESSPQKLIPLELVFTMLSNTPTLLTEMYLGITDVTCYEEDFSLEEVIIGLGLGNEYRPFNYDLLDLDGFIIDSELSEFTSICDQLPPVTLRAFAERYIYLLKLGEYEDRNKEAILDRYCKVGHVFDEYRYAKEKLKETINEE